jgi:hypothetical protein
MEGVVMGPRWWIRWRSGAATIVELLGAVAGGRLWWLVPLLALLIPIALVLAFLHSVPLVAPFVYTLF